MKACFVSDIHSSIEKALALKQKLLHNRVDLVVILGDFTNEGLPKIAAEILDMFSFARVLAIPGNIDSAEIAKLLEERGVNLHKKKARAGNYTFIGLGGGKPANCYYRFNIGELEAAKYLNKLIEGENPEKTIIASHTPPTGVGLDVTHSGAGIGLKALQRFIGETQPLLCVCGHVHEAKGIAKIGKTKCINAGALKDGSAVIVDLGKGLDVEWLEV